MQYLGIDIHKAFCQTTVMDQAGQILERAKVPTDERHLQEFFSSHRGSKAVIESNTVWEFVHEQLTRAGLEVTLAHPARVRAIASARIKTDKIDGDTLAHLLRTDLVPAAYVGTPELRELRQDVRMRRQLRALTSALKHQMSAEAIRKGIDVPSHKLRTAPGRAWVAKKLPRVRVQRRLKVLAKIEEELDDYNKDVLLPQYESNPKAKLLAEIPGVGFYTALTVIAELGDLDRFPDTDSIVSYAGLAPRIHQSSNVLRMGSITKAGPRQLRWVLTEAVHSHVRFCKAKDECKLCVFHARIKKRRGPNKATTATAAKMLRIMAWMLKMNQPYRPQGLDLGRNYAGEPRVTNGGQGPGPQGGEEPL